MKIGEREQHVLGWIVFCKAITEVVGNQAEVLQKRQELRLALRYKCG